MKVAYLLGLGLVVAIVAVFVASPPLQADLARFVSPSAATPAPGDAAASPTAVAQAPAPTPTDLPQPTATPIPPTATPLPPTATPEPTATPLPPTPTLTPTPKARTSLMADSTLLTIYGRGFGIAPILGRLGMYNNFDDMAKEVGQFSAAVAKVNGGKKIVPTVHLIYAMAIPCVPDDDCLLYLEGTQPDIVKRYIEPAQARGWQVILDSQLGRSDAVTQVKRMIDKGYLNYDNVQVALDPEFHSVPGHNTPGIPIGSLDAADINAAQALLDAHVQKAGLPHRKILIIHQFGDPNVDDGVPFMITNKKGLKTYDNVDLVIDMDGVGAADSKATKYNRILDAEVYPFIKYRALKLFLPNPYEEAGHYDQPQMSFEMAFGAVETHNGYKVHFKPDILIIA